MITVSKKVANFFLTKQPYVDVFGANRPFPVVAPEGTDFPFATYTIDRAEGKSKDGDEYSVTAYFWFDANNYTEMASLLEDIIPEIQNEYDFQAATMDFVEDNQSFVGIINFLINQ